jgi:recombination protein RecT
MSTATALTTISGDIYSARETFDLARVDTSLNFEREAGFAIQQLGRNDFTMKCAMNNRQSVYDAMVNVAAIGRSLNPATKEAYLVPRDGRICLDVSYIGLLATAVDSGAILWGQARLVHEADTFALHGFDKAPTHTYNPFSKDRGAIVGTYVVVKTAHGDFLTDTMTIDEAYAIRDRSAAWKAGKSGPWKTDEGEMIKKTVVKRASKMWPKSERLDSAIHMLNTDNGEGLAVIQEERMAALKGPVITPTGNPEIESGRLPIIEAVANAVIDLFNNNDLVGAYGEAIGITDGDEKIKLWKMLPSNIRSAIKKHGDVNHAIKEL